MDEELNQAPVAIGTASEPQPDESFAAVSLGDPSAAPAATLDSKIASNRAMKTRLGQPDFGKPYDAMFDQIMSGKEQELRSEAAANIDFKKSIQQQQIINQIASKSNGPLSPTDAEYIKQLVQKKQTDPNAVIEDGYSKTIMDNILQTARDNPDSFLNQAIEKMPEKVKEEIDEGTTLKFKKEKGQTWYEDMLSLYNSQSWGGWTADQAKVLIPFYNEIHLRGLTGDTSMFHGLLGTNLDEQAADLYRLPRDQFLAKGQQIFDKLKDDPSAGLAFFSAIVGQTRQERVLNNIMSGVGLAGDAATVGVGKLLRTAVKQTILREDLPVSRATINEATGNIKEAGVQQSSENIVKHMNGAGNPAKDSVDALQSVFNTGVADMKNDPRMFSQELVNRVAESYSAAGSAFTKGVADALKVDRIPAVLAVEKNVRDLIEHNKLNYPGIDNTIFDVKFDRVDPTTNVRYIDTMFNKDGTSQFGTESAAKAFAKENGLGQVSIEQNGAGFFVRKTTPFNIKDPLVQSLLLTTDETKTPNKFINAFAGGLIGRLRTPEDTLSLSQLMNRKTATTGPNKLFQIIEDTSKDINKLQSRSLGLFGRGNEAYHKWNDWKRVMAVAETTRDPGTGEVGNLFRSPGELSDLYQTVTGRVPDAKELAASFAYKAKTEMLDSLNKMREFRRQATQGAEKHTFQIPKSETAKSITFSEITANGVKLHDMPQKQAALLVVGSKRTNTAVKDMQQFSKTKTGKQAIEDIKSGKKSLIQVTNAEDRAFSRVAGESKVEYVLTDKVKSEPLLWTDVKTAKMPRHDYDHYVVQANVRHDPVTKLAHYEGDRAIMGHNLKAITSDYAQKLDKIRLLLKSGDVAGAKAFHATSGMQQEYSAIHLWFNSDVTTEGLPIKSMLSLDEPIRSVPNGKRVIDLDRTMQERYGSAFRDSHIDTRGAADPYDLFTVENTGTKASPLYNVAPAKYVDPMTTINRALTRAVNGTWLDDYKAFSVEHWIQEAKDFMKVDPNRLAANPYFFFFNHENFWKAAPSDPNMVANLKTANLQIQQFLGIQDKTSTWLHNAAQTLADSVYSRAGERAALVPASMLPKLRDPFAFVRSMIFNAKLGLFNPAQLWVQLNTYTNILGIAGPKHALPALKAAMLHTWARVNQHTEIMDYLDKLATQKLIPGTSSWRPGELIEAHNLLGRTGFELVKGENIYRDATQYYDLIGSRVDKFLNAGQFAFRESERFNRTTAFYAAYREFREIHPTGAVSDAQLRAMLQRADLLSTNMTRASASTLHRGIMSIPTTFLSYQLRLGEQFLGKRLTEAERIRLFGTYAAVYGIPGAFGLSGLPIGDYINKWAQEDGYLREDSAYVSHAATEGLPAMLLHLMTGNWYNIQQRYGVQGFEQIRDTFRSDKHFWDIVGGAPYSVLSQSIAHTDGFTNMVLSAIRGDGQFKPKIEDFVDPFLQISTLGAAKKLLFALNTGKIFSSNEQYLGDASKGNAIFMFLSGLSPAEQTRMFNENWTRQDEKDLQHLAQTEFVREMRRAFMSFDKNDRDNGEAYINRAYAYLKGSGFPIERYGEAISLALQDYESIVNKTDYNYYLKDVPEYRKDVAMEQFKKLMEAQK